MADPKKTRLDTPATRSLPNTALPVELTGNDIRLFEEYFGLSLIEVGMSFGLNTSSLYGKKRDSRPLNAQLSILMRLWCVYSDHIPRIKHPSIDDLMNRIREIDPDFKLYNLAPALGLEPNSSYRLLEQGLEDANQSTRVLAWLIYTLLEEDKENWKTIKQALYLQAEANQIDPPESIWKKGGWSRQRTAIAARKAAAKKASDAKAEPEKGVFTKTLRRRSSST